MNILGIILARAGSVGLPNKHLQPLLGRPVIEYSFDHARESRLLSRIVLTTDCARLRLIAQESEIESIARPAGLATADASVQETCLHALETIESRHQCRADVVVVLYGNVAVRPTGIVDRALAKLVETGCDSVRSLTPVGKWHPQWMHRLAGDAMQPLHANSIHRRQDLEPIYLHDGAVIAVTRESMLRAKSSPQDPHAFFGDDRRAVVSEMDQTVEIDHQRDIYWAEAVLRTRGAQPQRRRLAS